MTEAIKCIIWKKENHTINGKTVHKYLIGTILVTDQEIEGLPSKEGDNVAISQIPTDLNLFTNAYSSIPKFKPNMPLGSLSNAIMTLSNMSIEDLKD